MFDFETQAAGLVKAHIGFHKLYADDFLIPKQILVVLEVILCCYMWLDLIWENTAIESISLGTRTQIMTEHIV